FESAMVSTDGHSILHGHVITLNPLVGVRLPAGWYSFDLQAGVDRLKLLSDGFKEKEVSMHSEGYEIRFEGEISSIRQEVRPLLLVTVKYQKMSLYCGYFLGVLSYYGDYIGGNPEARMNTLRFGLQYRVL